MLREISQVVRLLRLMAEQKQQKGGLLLILWTDNTTPALKVNCTVAAAGPWCAQIKTEAFHGVFTDLKNSLFSFISSCPDPEELISFTEMHGSLRLLLSFQMKDGRHYFPEWHAHLEAFLRSFVLVNAGINIQLTLKFDQHTARYTFGAKVRRQLMKFHPLPLKLDVTSTSQPPMLVREDCWCQGGHPVYGSRLHLSIPTHAADEGLFGDLSIQFVSLLSPCVLQYPNLTTSISSMQLLVYTPSRIPVLNVPAFFQTLPASLDFQDLGVDKLHCSSSKEVQHCGATTYTVELQNCYNPAQESHAASQRLLVFLLVQHSDPFTSLLADVMATEVLIERHLEDILNNNQHAVVAALQSELRNILKAHNQRKKIKQKLHSAAEVILHSSISIVSCSSSLTFRQTCLNRMKVRDTRELSAAFRESLRRVTSWKYVPRHSCYSKQMEEHPERSRPFQAEL